MTIKNLNKTKAPFGPVCEQNAFWMKITQPEIKEYKQCSAKAMQCYLRVLLVKRPDTEEPTFLGQSMFGCIIKSTYLGDVPKAKS